MRRLALFAKYWQPGAVKTRLAGAIGEVAAAELHQAFVEALTERLAHVGDSRSLVVAPADQVVAFRQVCPPAWDVVPQATGDLGCRLRAFFDLAFAEGASRVVVIGADSPNLPTELVERAFIALDESATVLGPADDGGYYLVGSRGAPPPIFDDIPWSTSRVLQATIAELKAAGVLYSLLTPWYDVDELADLRRLDDDLEKLYATEADVADESAPLRKLRKAVRRALSRLPPAS